MLTDLLCLVGCGFGIFELLLKIVVLFQLTVLTDKGDLCGCAFDMDEYLESLRKAGTCKTEKKTKGMQVVSKIQNRWRAISSKAAGSRVF